jgi:pentapeptide MXKDX repeat protein
MSFRGKKGSLKMRKIWQLLVVGVVGLSLGLTVAGCGNSTSTGKDKMGGDKMGSDKMAGDKMGADKMTGDKMKADKMTGEKMGADKITGDKANTK